MVCRVRLVSGDRRSGQRSNHIGHASFVRSRVRQIIRRSRFRRCNSIFTMSSSHAGTSSSQGKEDIRFMTSLWRNNNLLMNAIAFELNNSCKQIRFSNISGYYNKSVSRNYMTYYIKILRITQRTDKSQNKIGKRSLANL